MTLILGNITLGEMTFMRLDRILSVHVIKTGLCFKGPK